MTSTTAFLGIQGIDASEEVLLAVVVSLLVIVGVIALIVFLRAQKRAQKHLNQIQRVRGKSDPSNKKFSFIINPSKPFAKQAEEQILHYFKYRDLLEPEIKYTTIENPGNQQAMDAALAGQDVVVACGGDGTVRSVACGLARVGLVGQVEMGIIPIGTGNLLARNLNLPINEIQLALDVVVFGLGHSIDLGWVTKVEEKEFSHAFAVIAGVGFDANMVRETSPELKKKIGFFAYFAAGIKEAFAKKFEAEIELQLEDGTTKHYKSKLRSVMVGNCGRIPGFNLIPDASFKDGLLDVVAIDTSAGFLGWGQIAADMFLQNFGVQYDSKWKLGRIEHIQAVSVNLKFDTPQEVDCDGDLIGKTSEVHFGLAPGGLVVRLP